MYPPTSPACQLVPHAVITTRCTRPRSNWVLDDAPEPGISFLRKETSPHHVGDTRGLLEDLLEHEVLVAAFLDRIEIPRHLVNATVNLLAFQVVGAIPIGREYGIVPVVEIDDVTGRLDHRRCVGAGKHLAVLTHADEQRTAVTRHDDLVRVSS